MGEQMFLDARAVILASLPPDLPPAEVKRRLYERMYGYPLPADFPVQLLRERNADPHHKNHAGRTPVELARMIGNYNVAQFFADLPI